MESSQSSSGEEMSEGASPGVGAPALACLSGGRPDEKLIQDWAIYQSMAEPVRDALFELLQSVYRLPLGAELAERVAGFAQQAGADPMRVQSALDACRFLFNHAAGAGVSLADLQKDLESLRPEGREGIDQFLVHYRSFGPIRRQEALRDSLLDHGKVLTAVDWRIDMARTSSRAARMDAPVLVLTFGYREGSGDRGRTDSVSLQIPASEFGSLRSIMDRVEIALATTADPQHAEDGS